MNKTGKQAASTDAHVSQVPVLSVQPVLPTYSTTSGIGLGIAPEQKFETSSPSLAKALHAKRLSKDGVGPALSDTPLPSAPPSPKM